MRARGRHLFFLLIKHRPRIYAPSAEICYTVSMENSGISSLISKIHADSASFLKAEMQSRGLPDLVSSHGNILFQLSQAGSLSMKELSERIHRDKSTTTALVNKLVGAGFVVREKDSTDSRITHISLTETGRNYNDTLNAISDTLNRRCCQGLSADEQKTLFELLSRIAGNFR